MGFIFSLPFPQLVLGYGVYWSVPLEMLNIIGLPLPNVRPNKSGVGANDKKTSFFTVTFNNIGCYPQSFTKLITLFKRKGYFYNSDELKSSFQSDLINLPVTLDNLEEDSKYEARVSARNVWGWSNQSDVFKFFTRTKGESISTNMVIRTSFMNLEKPIAFRVI